MKAEGLKAKVLEVLDDLAKIFGKKQFELNAGKNAWILKPGGKSRGRGIEIHDHMEDLLKSIMVSKDNIWITQKYIESPMIILGKKFDIRVWALISSVEPLRIWYFTTPYLRFTASDYDATKLRNKLSHLTNACVSKDGNQRTKRVGNYSISNNMWESHNFATYVADKFGASSGSADPFQEILVPQLKAGVVGSILACKEVL